MYDEYFTSGASACKRSHAKCPYRHSIERDGDMIVDWLAGSGHHDDREQAATSSRVQGQDECSSPHGAGALAIVMCIIHEFTVQA